MHIDTSNIDMDEYLDNIIDHKGHIRRKYSRLCEYFGDVPIEIQNRFKSNPSGIYIIENLQTHDSGLLIRKIQERFPQFEISDISFLSTERIKYVRIFVSYRGTDKNTVQEFINSKELVNLLDFFGYAKSKTTEDFRVMGNVGTILDIDPILTEYADKEYIRETCHNKLYHITLSENSNSIERNGLRVRKGSGYRDYPERVYLFAVPPKGKFNAHRREFKEAAVYFISDPYDYSDVDVTIYEVECGWMTLYRDVASEETGIGLDCYFSYESISPKYIRKVWQGSKESLLYS